MTIIKLFGAALLLLSGIVFLRSYRKYEKERIKTAASLLGFLRRAAEAARGYLTPISDIVLSVEDELLLRHGFVTEYKESHALSAAYARVAGRYSGRVFSLLRDSFSSLADRLSSRADFTECDKISAALELEKEESEKNIKIASTLTIAAILGLIILFL